MAATARRVTRRRFLAASSAALALAACRRTAKRKGDARPLHVVLIVSDDQAFEDAGCYGNRTIRTPQLDRFATTALRFTNAFTPTAICQPSRGCIHTGLYGTSSGADGFTPIRKGVPTLSATLKDVGYRTGLVGKTQLAPIQQFRFDFLHKSDEFSGGRDVAAMVTCAETFVRDSVAAGEPFFLNVNFDDPHYPWPITRAEMEQLLPSYVPGAPRSMDPRWIAFGDVAGTHDPATVRMPALLPDRPVIRKELARYCDAIFRMDRGVGLLLDLLERLKVAQQTVVVFLSDNGMDFPFHKTTLWEGGIKQPLMIRWPGLTRGGATCDGLVSFVDLMPTLLDGLGIEPARKLEGRSFRAALADPSAPLREELFLTHTADAQTRDLPSRGVRTRRFKYLRNPWPKNATFWNKDMNHESWDECQRAAKDDPALAERIERLLHRPPFELYDLESDPLERRNLVDSADHASIREMLHGRLKALAAEIDDPLAATL
jgi:N-sulfoglucosamine sulfohydrolase